MIKLIRCIFNLFLKIIFLCIFLFILLLLVCFYRISEYQKVIENSFNGIEKYEDVNKKIISTLEKGAKESLARTNDSYFLYEVQPGETLFSIGMKYNFHWKVILKANKLQDPDEIYAGMKLIIPLRKY